MGAAPFSTASAGVTAKDAFDRATQDARYEHGHGGYSGTLAEKRAFVEIKHPTLPAGTLPTLAEARALANKLIEDNDERVDDKWGPAGCIEFKPGPKAEPKVRGFLFFGWASS